MEQRKPTIDEIEKIGDYNLDKAPPSRRAIVYGGGLSTPLLLINLDSQTGAPSSDAENVLHRTDTAVARSNIAVANKTE